MNAIRCPNCNSINQLSAVECGQCRMTFANLPATARVSVPVEQTYEAQTAAFPRAPMPGVLQDNETGRKAFLWYRVYCGVMVALYLAMTIFGAVLAYAQPQTREYSPSETLAMGIIYAVIGLVFLAVFAVALFLPRKPYNWIVALVLMALGMTSCCFLPALIPLLIYWLKPETRAYFGRG